MNEPRLRVSLLGRVRAWRGDDELTLGSARRRAVLAVLASRANQVVTRSELIDAVWGESPPASANGCVHTYISALRSVLEPDRPRNSWQVLVSAGAGYCLRLGEGALDLDGFTALRDRAREVQRDTASELAALDAALGLWRGDAFDGIPGPYADAQRARLTDLRLSTVERRAQLLVDAGRARRVVDELRPLCAAHPLREGLHLLLMQALTLTGRRAEAVAVFHRSHVATVDRLGVEPGPRLNRLYEQVRRGSPTQRLLRWAALCGEVFTAGDLAAVMPGPELPGLLDEVSDLLTESHGLLSFRDPQVRRALRDKPPLAVRTALHRQFAEALAKAGAPAELVAEQLVQAPVEADAWLCDWLSAEIGALAPRTAMLLLRRVLAADSLPGRRKEEFVAHLMRQLDRTPSNVVARRNSTGAPSAWPPRPRCASPRGRTPAGVRRE